MAYTRIARFKAKGFAVYFRKYGSLIKNTLRHRIQLGFGYLPAGHHLGHQPIEALAVVVLGDNVILSSRS